MAFPIFVPLDELDRSYEKWILGMIDHQRKRQAQQEQSPWDKNAYIRNGVYKSLGVVPKDTFHQHIIHAYLQPMDYPYEWDDLTRMFGSALQCWLDASSHDPQWRDDDHYREDIQSPAHILSMVDLHHMYHVHVTDRGESWKQGILLAGTEVKDTLIFFEFLQFQDRPTSGRLRIVPMKKWITLWTHYKHIPKSMIQEQGLSNPDWFRLKDES